MPGPYPGITSQGQYVVVRPPDPGAFNNFLFNWQNPWANTPNIFGPRMSYPPGPGPNPYKPMAPYPPPEPFDHNPGDRGPGYQVKEPNSMAPVNDRYSKLQKLGQTSNGFSRPSSQR